MISRSALDLADAAEPIMAPHGNQVARGLCQPRGDAQLQPVGATAACNPARVLAAHPGAGSLGRNRSGGSQFLSHPAHAGGQDPLRGGAGHAAVAAEHAGDAEGAHQRRQGHGRVRGSAHAGLHVLSCLAFRAARALRTGEEPADRPQRARRGAAPGGRGLRPADRLPPPLAALAAGFRPVRDAHARSGKSCRPMRGRTPMAGRSTRCQASRAIRCPIWAMRRGLTWAG